ncbi:MAG: iron-containing alcohol dehydrogenase [Spirochaetales bacterium]|nr:iron-containing alcohol dehydrogenase [Spirochaetales bacterium]
MNDFSFCIPTRFVVGKGSPAGVGDLIRQYGGHRVLIVDDGGAYLKELFATVRSSIESAGLVAFEAQEKAVSPRLSIIMKNVEFCRANDIDFVLAVGGGTVMDTAKGIAFFCENDGDLTEYVLYRKASPRCMKVASVVTLAGTGSEISATAMIMDDRQEPGIKYPLFQESIRFLFSVMDPSLTCSLPMRTSMAGAFDSITHIMEHYFCGKSAYDLQDRMCEAVMKSIMLNMRAVKNDPQDYETRAQLQMGATLGNSTLLGIGCDSDWAVHYMENPVTTMTHNLHGSTLAIIAVAWMRLCHGRDLAKAVHFATRVMDVSPQETDEKTAVKGIDALESFLKEMGLPVRLSEIGVGPEMFEDLADRALQTAGSDRVGGVSRLTREEVLKVYELAK